MELSPNEIQLAQESKLAFSTPLRESLTCESSEGPQVIGDFGSWESVKALWGVGEKMQKQHVTKEKK